MTAYLVIAFILVMDLTVGFFGSYAGYTVNGVVRTQAATWNWTDMVVFLWDMTTFQVDDMPYFLSAVFLIFQLMIITVLIRTVRGVE